MLPLLQHRGVQLVGGGWSFFIAENVVLSHNREFVIRSIGDDNYHRVYNTLSCGACFSIAYGYLRHGRGTGPRVSWSRRPASRAGALVLQALGLVGFSQLVPRLQLPVTLGAVRDKISDADEHAVAPVADSTVAAPAMKVRVRCPMDFTPVDMPEDGVHGLLRVTRHPTLWSLGLLGLGSALATPFATEAVMFSMPSVFALIGGAHQDYRYRRGWGGELPEAVDEVTCNVPFIALFSGAQPWTALFEELKWTNAALAVSAALLLAGRRRLMPPR